MHVRIRGAHDKNRQTHTNNIHEAIPVERLMGWRAASPAIATNVNRHTVAFGSAAFFCSARTYKEQVGVDRSVFKCWLARGRVPLCVGPELLFNSSGKLYLECKFRALAVCCFACHSGVSYTRNNTIFSCRVRALYYQRCGVRRVMGRRNSERI